MSTNTTNANSNHSVEVSMVKPDSTYKSQAGMATTNFDYDKLAETFWLQGYLLIENFFSSDLMDDYNRVILNHYGVDPAFSHNDEFLQKASTEVIPWFPQAEGVDLFNAVENDERLQSLTKAILGEQWQALYCMTMFSKQGTKGQAWHQDCEPDDASQFNVNRLVYTHDITPEMGGQTLVVPGSHKRGVITVGQPDETFSDQLVISPKKGTLLLLHGHAWHRVLPVKGSYRVSTNYRCMPKGVAESVTDICVYRNMRYKFETNTVVEDRTQN